MATIEHLSADATTDAIGEELERDGEVIIDGLMASDEEERMKEEEDKEQKKEFCVIDELPC